MIELLELKFSRRWQTNKIESDWSNSPRHSSSRQFRSPRKNDKRKATITKTFIFVYDKEIQLHFNVYAQNITFCRFVLSLLYYLFLLSVWLNLSRLVSIKS